MSLMSSRNCKTLYFEQREGDEPETEASAETSPAASHFNSVTGYHSKQLPDISVRKLLDTLTAQYVEQNPISEKLFWRARESIAGGNTRSVLDSDPFPIIIKSAADAKLKSVDGRYYLDFVSDFTAGLYGHSNPVIQQAIVQAASNGVSLGAVTELEAQLGEVIKERYPSIDLLRYCNSGTEANTYAIAAGLAYTGRKKVMVFDNAYHGGTISFGHGDHAMNLPHQWVMGAYDAIEATRAVLDNDIGVIIIELMQSAGGMRSVSTEFAQFLRSAADEIGAVLIFDEVVTARLEYHGLQGFHGVTPDMTTLGKFHGGGLSFGAFGGKRPIMAQFDRASDAPKKLPHSGTFNNNAFTMTAAVAASKLFTKAEVDRINRMGDRLRSGIRDIAAEAGLDRTMVPIGIGSCVGVEFLGPPRSEELREAFYFHHLAQGIWFGRRGFACLNFAHQESDIDRLLLSTKLFVQSLI